MGLRARLRWTRQPDGTSPWWGIAILLVGIALVLLGWFWEGTWEDVFIEVGAAAGVGGIVLLFKPRLMRQVGQVATDTATTTATAITSSATEALEERLVQLERVGEIQATEMKRKQAKAAHVVSTVGADASHANIQELLNDAYDRELFLHNVVLKTGEDTGQPLLRVTQDVLDDPPHTESIILFDILVLTDVSPTYKVYRQAKVDAVHWGAEHDTSTLVGELIDNFMRANVPYDELSVERSLRHLQESYSLMVRARDEPKGSSRRLNGKLVFLINDEWVLTSSGLEATQSDILFRWNRDDVFGYSLPIGKAPCPTDCSEHLWMEAKLYALQLIPNDDWQIGSR